MISERVYSVLYYISSMKFCKVLIGFLNSVVFDKGFKRIMEKENFYNERCKKSNNYGLNLQQMSLLDFYFDIFSIDLTGETFPILRQLETILNTISLC
jgi:hypothetical protein